MQVGVYLRRGPLSRWEPGVITDGLPTGGLTLAIRSWRDGTWDLLDPRTVHSIRVVDHWAMQALRRLGIPASIA